jgi:hypothetical protein
MKARLTELDAKRTQVSLRISRKSEERSVEVEAIQDFKRGKYFETRLDTGEVIFERPLYDSELQANLELAK